MDESGKACSLEVMRMFRSCSHLLYHRKRATMRGPCRLLILLLEHDGITQREMLDLTNIRSASLSEALSRMEVDGLITRHKCESDRRNIALHLTEAGLEEARRVKQRQHDEAVRLFSALSAEERRQLLELLTRLRDDWLESCPQEDVAPSKPEGPEGMDGPI